MIDINIIRTNKELVVNNLKKKYQEYKIPVLDEILDLDTKVRELKITGDNLRQERNKTSDEILSNMRPTTRQSVRSSMKNCLKIIECEEKDLEEQEKAKLMILSSDWEEMILEAEKYRRKRYNKYS